MPLTPQDFVSKWKRVTAREKQIYQEHFLDLCALTGHQTPNDYDPSGTRFGFEMGAAKTSGGQGWADVAKLGYFGWEYKAKDADLDKAYEQLLLYRDALKNPPLLIVSDINNIIIRTNFTNVPTRTISLTLDDLLKPESIKTLKAVFTNPESLKPQVTVESVTREAAGHFAKLAENLRKYGNDPQEIAHFLIRLLFCLFAEDIGLLPEKMFPRLLEQTRRNSADFSEVLRQLFRAMKSGGYFGADKILHFNGGLFDDDRVLPLDGADMDIIADIDALDWAAIEPSIFGTLFERGLDPSKRSQLGAHYTSRDDILLIVEPVLMAPLRREWEQVKDEVRGMKAEEADLPKGKKKSALQKNIKDKLLAFADRIAATKVLDPACGSGNFLYVALRLLLDLQKEVINFSDEMGAGRFFVSVTPSQVFGIEINEYAHELAQMTIQIGYIQWLRDNGYGLPSEPILRPMQNILQMDAILARETFRDSQSLKVFEPKWPSADVIIGNPPFLGDRKMRRELGDKYVDELRKLYEDRLPGGSDLVCYWFEKARAMIEEGKVKRAGLLATQGIRGGLNRTVLDRINSSGNIFWAESDRAWILDGAVVHVSMIGFDNGKETNLLLDGKKVDSINSDLSSTADTTLAQTLVENAKISFIGTQKSGPFDLTNAQAQEMLSSKGNPNTRSNRDIVKPWINAIDITQKTRNMWVIDFGPNMSLEEASKYELPFEYVKKHVKPIRDVVRRAAHKKKWWLFGDTRPGMRLAVAPLSRYIVTPMVSKHRVFVWQEKTVIPENLLVVIARDDDYFFGVLHSKLHELWSRLKGTQLREAESGTRYTPTSTFETFPFPWAPGKEPKNDPRVKAIGQAAQELVEQRDRWLNAVGADGRPPLHDEGDKKKRTLTNLYNQRPTWLDLAHKRLDEAVFAAYGWPSDLSEEEILERLLKLNLERAKR
ncbi:MAG: class I SAM-dependent DNA methyltransferase [Anaerolineaceae bacterium]|nr:MAG: class I SAM-dependent DNA methyltransferase [Anaerolineaceae bacterium]